LQSLNFDETIKDISSDVNLNDFVILTPDLQSQLSDVKSAADMDFASFRTEVSLTLFRNLSSKQFEFLFL